MRSPRGWLRLWFTFEEGVSRRDYLVSGLALAAVKYAGDVLIVWTATRRLWYPLDYLSPVQSLMATRLNRAPPGAITVRVRSSSRSLHGSRAAGCRSTSTPSHLR